VLQAIYDPLRRFTDQVVVEPSYIIFQESGKVYAKNGRTGQIEFSDADVATVIQSAINTLTNGGKIVIKSGYYELLNTIQLHAGISIEGEGITGPYTKKSTLLIMTDPNKDIFYCADNDPNYFLEISNMFIGYPTVSGHPSPGNGTAVNIVGTIKDIHITKVYIGGAPKDGIYITNGWGFVLLDSIVEFCGRYGVYIGTYGTVAKIIGNKINGNGVAGLLNGASYSLFVGNEFDNNNGYGLWIGANDCAIVGNIFASNSRGSIGTYSDLRLDANTHHNVVVGNSFWGDNKAKYNIRISSGAHDNLIVGNTFKDYVTSAIGGTGDPTLQYIHHNIGYITENGGTATFSGDGTTTTFKIAHGLASVPTTYYVEAASADAAGEKYVTADATYLYVIFKTAPPAGTNNVVLRWYAEV